MQLGDSCLWPANVPLSDTAHIPYLFSLPRISSFLLLFKQACPELETQESQVVSRQRCWKKHKYAEKLPSFQPQWAYSKAADNVIDNTDTSEFQLYGTNSAPAGPIRLVFLTCETCTTA